MCSFERRSSPLEAKAIQTQIIRQKPDLLAEFLRALDEPLQDKDVVCVTSKLVALEQDRLVRLADVQPSAQARQMQKLRYAKDLPDQAQFAELVLQEADALFEGDDGYIYLALKNHVFIANAGVDLSNVPEGYAILWPEEPWRWASQFREKLKSHYGLEQLGVLITDSHVIPLRRGVTGLALAYAGFEGVQSEIGQPDLFGKPLRVTEKAIADDLASVAVLLMGEADESKPFALIRGAPVIFTDREIDPLETFINPSVDLYAGMYNENFKLMLSE